jgi:hypothetical protein
MIFRGVFSAGTMGLVLTACATYSVPKSFLYETSVRGEQGWQGSGTRAKAAASLVEAGVVTPPADALQTAFPTADIKVRRWGLSYFAKDWTRYQVVMEADIQRGDKTEKCRMRAPETPVGAMTLKEVRAENGMAFQLELQALISACITHVNAPKPSVD